jgi:AraC-like DNA-binding protein
MDKPQDPTFFSHQIAGARRFHLDHLPAGGVLAVVSGGREHCTADYEIHRRSFPFRGVEFVASGKGKVGFGGREFPLVAGSVFSYGPRTPHDIVTDRSAPMVKYFVDFTGTRAAALLRDPGPAPGEVVQTSAPDEVMAVFDELIRNGLSQTPFSARITTVMLEHLLLKIAETAIPNGSSASPAFATYRRCRQFIQDHWPELDTLGQMAAACHVDPAYLCRLFRRFDHQSPYQLLLRLKLRHAAARLRGGRVPVAVVAEELRFADPFHFSRAFKQLMGIPPSAFARLRA